MSMEGQRRELFKQMGLYEYSFKLTFPQGDIEVIIVFADSRESALSFVKDSQPCVVGVELIGNGCAPEILH